MAPNMRACSECAAQKKRCDHKVPVVPLRKNDGLRRKQRSVEPADEVMLDAAASDHGTKVNKRKAAQVEEVVPEAVRNVRRRSLRKGGGNGRHISEGSNAGSTEEGGFPEAPNGLPQNQGEKRHEDLSSVPGGDPHNESLSPASVSPPAIEIASPTPSIAPEVETRGPSPLADDTEEEKNSVRPPPAPSPPPTRSQLPSSNVSPAPGSSPSTPSTPSPQQAPIRPHSRWVDPTKPAGRFSGARRYTPLALNTDIYGGRIPPPAPTPPPASR
ncbi:hypothetical protein B9Z19DRAFT_1137300 [Tuber borchii]|uniref:Zn(2)-C6 fungal-type domain-containing protein n=1 Tax=Tuber borchii TaxID=42251 RepID=A0A2T6ZAN0_TUBBO|nr:hypothetical protein B9Z19DRAFT_1137300 [Tuber borchii]